MLAKVINPVVYCARTGRLAVPEGAIGTVQGIVWVGSQIGVSILFPEDSDVLDNGHIKQWSFLPNEIELIKEENGGE